MASKARKRTIATNVAQPQHEARLQSEEVGKLNLSQITCASELPAQPSEVALTETAPPKKGMGRRTVSGVKADLRPFDH